MVVAPWRRLRSTRSRASGNEHPRHLYGVGLGPGDPELVTVKAARVISQADVVAYHSARHGRSIARRIAEPYLRPGQIEEHLVYPVTTETTEHPAATGRPWRSSTRWPLSASRHIWPPVATSRCSPRAIRCSTAPTCTCTPG